MKHLGDLKPAEGSTHKKKRIGRGPGSGHGGTSTRGHKGQKARSGAKVRRGFEGGQMPLNRRLPKFGFSNRDRVEYQTVNVGRIQVLIDENLIREGLVDKEVLYSLGAIRKTRLPLKILGNGEISSAITLTADAISETAKAKIESAGGTITING